MARRTRTVAPVRRRVRAAKITSPEPAPSLWKRIVPVIIAFAIGGLLFGGGGYLVGRPSESQQQIDQLRQADAERDKQQIAALTGLARSTRDSLLPVLTGMSAALPVAPGPGPRSASAAEVTGWVKATDTAAASFANPPSGSTATNVARGALTSAIAQLSVAVRTYSLSLTADSATAPGLRDLAGKQRTNAVTAWSVAATQLDQINIDAGYGHQHVFLPADPGSAAFTADGAPEGSQGR